MTVQWFRSSLLLLQRGVQLYVCRWLRLACECPRIWFGGLLWHIPSRSSRLYSLSIGHLVSSYLWSANDYVSLCALCYFWSCLCFSRCWCLFWVRVSLVRLIAHVLWCSFEIYMFSGNGCWSILVHSLRFRGYEFVFFLPFCAVFMEFSFGMSLFL